MLKEVTIFCDWEVMTAQGDTENIDEQATKESYEIMVEQWLRDRHCEVNRSTEINFEWTDNPRYSHECDNGLDDEIQYILERVWGAQGFWVEIIE